MDIEQGFAVLGTVDTAEAFAVADDHGFDFLELDMEQAFPASQLDADRIRTLRDRHDIDIIVHLPYSFDVGTPYDHVRTGACAELEAAIDMALDIGATKGVYHASTGVGSDPWSVDTLRESLFESVTRLCAYVEGRDIELCVENMPGSYFSTDLWPDLFQQTNAQLCLDTGHAEIMETDGNEQAVLLREYGERISHVHLNDIRGHGDDEHLPIGMGAVEFEPITRTMVETNWNGTCTHELFAFNLAYTIESQRQFEAHLADAE